MILKIYENNIYIKKTKVKYNEVIIYNEIKVV